MGLFVTRFTSELAGGNLSVLSRVCLGTGIRRLPGNFKLCNLFRLADGSIETDACFYK